MNKQDFLQTGGFPFELDTLDNMQNAYDLFNSFGELAGDKAIIKGCEVAGGNTTDGVVYIDGELFKFVGGATQPSVKILQNITSKEFEDGDTNEVHFERYVTFASGTGSMPWNGFSRPFSLLSITSRITELEKQNAVFQANGAMVFWNKPVGDIPDGWQEVEDWRGRMPVGFDSTQTEFNVMGKQGGLKNKTLDIYEIPPHYHHQPGSPFRAFASRGADVPGDNTHTLASLDDVGGNSELAIGGLGTSYAEGGNALERTIGGGQSFSLMNPYRVVMFIEYIG